jgi:hypothetical protein
VDDATHRGEEGRSVISTRRMEAIVAALLFLFGAVFMFPFYVALIICAGSLAVLIGTFRGHMGSDDVSFVERGQFKLVLSVLIPAGVYILGIELIGIYIASVIYIALFMRILGKYSWLKSVVISVVICVLFFFMFEVWFQVPLYKGMWNLTGWTGY